MGRRKNGPAEAEGDDEKRAKVRHLIGGNVAPETLKRHFAEIGALESELKAVQQKLKTAWTAAESDGIAKKPFKLVRKLFAEDPAAADAFMRQVQSYSTQLGLFDRIDAWKQAEANEANGASIEAAEREQAGA